jgi:hypothetical protein
MPYSRDDLRTLSKNSLLDAKLNRMNRSANLRRQMKELKAELWDVRSDLALIEHLLALTHVVQFPTPAANPVILKVSRRKTG